MKKLISKIKNNEKVIKLFFYVIFGIGTTAISILSYVWLLLMNVQYIIAATLSWILTVTFSYVSNRKIVFGSTAKGIKEVSLEYIKFTMGRVSTYILNMLALTFFVESLKMDPFYSNMIINIVIVFINYFLSKLTITKTSSQGAY